MRWFAKLQLRLRSLLHRDALDEELESELQFYLEHRTQELVSGGLDIEDARREARLTAGSMVHLREDCRDARGVAGLQDLAQDVRHGVRSLLRHHGSSLMSIALIAMSIGLACSAFALLDAVLLRGLPGTTDPARLVRVTGVQDNDDRRGHTLPMYRLIGAQRELVSHVFAFRSYGALPTRINTVTVPLRGIALLGDYFGALGAVPLVRGRTFDPDKDAPVAIISSALWEEQFGRAPDILGKSFTLGDISFTVVGVARADFVGTQPDLQFDFLAPFATLNRARGLSPAATRNQEVVTSARLRPGVTPEQYQARLATLWPEILRATVPSDGTLDNWTQRWGRRLNVESLRSGLAFTLITNPGLPRALTLTAWISALIFVASCVTLALLVVARSMRTQRHTVIRLSLGGSRWRVVRPDLIECAIVSLLGGGCGILLAWWGTNLGAEFVPGDWHIGITPSVVAIAFLMAATTAVVGGTLGVYLSARGSLRDLLQQASQTGSIFLRLRTAFLALQLGLAVVLMHSTVEYMKDLLALTRVDVGLNTDDLHIYTLAGRLPQRALGVDYFRQLQDEVQALPGAESVALSAGSAPLGFLRDLVQPVDTDDGRNVNASLVCVFPGVFETWGVPRVSGREFAWSDGPVAVVTQSMARRLYPDQDPLSRWVSTRTPSPHDYEIVGVVGDMAFNGPRLGQRDVVFVPCLERTNPWLSGSVINIFVRSSTRSLTDLRRDVGAIVDRKAAQYVWEVDDQATYLDYAVEQERMLATVSGAFGGLVVVLTGVGLYAFCNYMLAFRSRELAIRAGLGAGPREIMATLLRETGIVIAAGLTVGVVGIFLLRRLLTGFVVEVAPMTWANLGQVMLVLVVVVIAASAIPAARALRIELARTLRLD